MTYLKDMKIVYVEDDTETREALGHYLKRRCGKVYCAEDAETGLVLFETYDPDILIVDLLLPGMNGLDMIRKIRNTGSSVPILITTTVGEAESVISSMDQGVCSYLLKPLDANQLETKLEDIAGTIWTSRDLDRKRAYNQGKNKGIIEENMRVDFLKLIKGRSGKGPAKVDILDCMIRNRII